MPSSASLRRARGALRTLLLPFVTLACAHGPVADPAATSSRFAAPAPAAAATVAPTGCGAVGPVSGPATHPLLGGRLRVALAGNGRLALPPPRVAPPPDTMIRESEFALTAAGDALVVHVIETLTTAPPNLIALADATPGASIAPSVAMPAIPNAPMVWGRLADDARPIGGHSASLGHALLAMPEGTLVSVEVEFWGETNRPAPRACQEAVRSLLASLELGDARLDLAGGRREIGPPLELTVPAGYAVEAWETDTEHGLLIERPRPYGRPAHRLTVVVTEHPPNLGNARERSGPYLGRTVSWRNGYGEGFERRTAILRIPGHVEYAYSTLEVATLDDVAEMVALAGRMRVRR